MKLNRIILCFFLLMTPVKVSLAQEETGKTAVFAMGCFWCGEAAFRYAEDPEVPMRGVLSVRVGYAGGTAPNPTYKSHDGYKEAVKVVYDPDILSYEDLLGLFWFNIDPLNGEGQFCDVGPSYTSVIYYLNNEQKEIALRSLEDVTEELNVSAVATEIIPFTTFYEAEEYHQNYKAKKTTKYKLYRWLCGRDKRLLELWSK